MTSATDNRTTELRKLLDERGVEYVNNDGKFVKETRWTCKGHITAVFGEHSDGVAFYMRDMSCITPEQAIAATLDGGAFTIKQIKDAVLKNFYYDHLTPPQFDWQAIADELNAELVSGTCEMGQLIRDMHRECTVCGYSCRTDNGECGIIQRIRELGIEVDA